MLPEPTTGRSKTRNLGFGTPHAQVIFPGAADRTEERMFGTP